MAPGLNSCGPRHLPGPGIAPVSPALAGRFFTTEPPEKPSSSLRFKNIEHSLGYKTGPQNTFHRLLESKICKKHPCRLLVRVPRNYLGLGRQSDGLIRMSQNSLFENGCSWGSSSRLPAGRVWPVGADYSRSMAPQAPCRRCDKVMVFAEQSFSNGGSWSRSLIIIWELVKNAEFWTFPEAYESESLR